MSHPPQDPLEHAEVRLASVRAYVIGALVAAAAMLAALWLVEERALSPTGLNAALGLLAVLAIGVQLRYLFELGLSETRRWHTAALIFAAPLFALAVGLTFWMFHSLLARTMLPGIGM